MFKKALLGFAVIALAGTLYLSGGKNLTASLISTPKDKSMVTLKTTLGDISIKLYTDKTPITSQNFLDLANDGKYDETIFHRVIKGFMVQGGDFENFNGTGGYSANGGLFEDEFAEGLSHVRGAVSMANRGPNTNGSQFFLVHKDATFLDGRHSVFGHVVEGMDIVDKITEQQTDFMDAPLEKIIIKSIQTN